MSFVCNCLLCFFFVITSRHSLNRVHSVCKSPEMSPFLLQNETFWGDLQTLWIVTSNICVGWYMSLAIVLHPFSLWSCFFSRVSRDEGSRSEKNNEGHWRRLVVAQTCVAISCSRQSGWKTLDVGKAGKKAKGSDANIGTHAWHGTLLLLSCLNYGPFLTAPFSSLHGTYCTI